MKKIITPVMIAEVLNVKDEYLAILAEQEIKRNYIESELKEAFSNFINSDFVEFPK